MYDGGRREYFSGCLCAALQDGQNEQTRGRLQKSCRLLGLLFFHLRCPELYLTLCNRGCSESVVLEDRQLEGEETPRSGPSLSLGHLGKQQQGSAGGLGSQEFNGYMPSLSSSLPPSSFSSASLPVKGE